MANFLEKIFSKLFGSKSERELKKMMPIVEAINAEYEKLKSLSNDELRHKTQFFKNSIKEYLREIDEQIETLQTSAASIGDVHEKDAVYKQIDELKKDRDKRIEEILNQLLPEAFAVVKEAAFRFTHAEVVEATATELDRYLATRQPAIEINENTVRYHTSWMAAGSEVRWNMVHYDVQLIGGIVLHEGKIAEMATGEGKTLVATLPAYLNALAGEGVHIVTVNDYLARRDCEWNGPLFNFLGLTVDCIDKYQPHSEARKKAYQADITYGTNNEFGFDYLRDNMVRSPEEMVQRKHHFAMVDEVDSVLIDDARTPLIISGQVESSDEKEFYELKPRISRLVEVQKRMVSQFLTDAKRLIKEGKDGYKEGEGGLALYRAYRALPKNTALIKFLSEPGVQQILRNTENFYLQDQQKNMPEVDKELYFVIDEKNNSVELTDKGIELITGVGEDPLFFVIPDVGAQIADIEKDSLSAKEKLEKKDKLMQEFAIKSERIHTVHQLLKAYSLFERDVDYVVMDGKVKIVDENTGRILEGRRYSDGLHQAIEAKENVKVEAASQTLATITLQNYFRMYHKLAGMTGTAETEAAEFWDIYKLEVSTIPTNKPVIREDKEDLVYKTKREKYNAIIEDIVKLTAQGRPVLVGTTSVEVSELLSRMLTLRKIKHNVLNAKQHQREAEIVAEAGKAGTVTIATNMAGRGTDIKISEEVKKAGGLAIIGSERHDSRRVDRQLRGRAGRQGDPGSSQFYLSLEDDLMRLFGSERISKLMDRMGYKEGEVLQHSMITSSIERAQKKVEENNFGVRKRLLEYDDVMNKQRDVIYSRRRHALFGERLALDILNSFEDLAHEITQQALQLRSFDQFQVNVYRYFHFDTSINEQEFLKGNADELSEKLFQQIYEQYQAKMSMLTQEAFPVLQAIYRDRGDQVKNVAIPFSEDNRSLYVYVDLKQVIDSQGSNLKEAFERDITLVLIDEAWKRHLRAMDDLKQEVQTAGYEQKDPLVVYKIEAFKLFQNMLSEVNKQIASFLFKGKLPAPESKQQAQAAQTPKQQFAKRINESRGELESNPSQPSRAAQQAPPPREKMEPVRVGPKVGRNDPCPCGSGKKFKACHGRDIE
jgi:preprotein translocase subunit SecA